MVRLVFNGLAIEHVPGAEWDRFFVSAAFQDPRLCTPAASAFLADPDLSRLFPGAERKPDGDGRIGATSLLTWLPGGGGTTFLSIVIGCFVEQTLARMRFMEALTEERIVDFVHESLDQIRRFSRGEDVEILVLTGLVGVATKDSINRGTWGMRPATGLAIPDIPSRDNVRPKSVLWTKVPHRLISCHRADIDEAQVASVFGNLSEQHRDFHIALRRKAMTLRFGLLAWAVGSEEHTPINVQSTASWSLLPIAMTQPPWIDTATGPIGETTLTALDLTAVADVIEEVGEVAPKLDIALNRMIRVASERRDPADALIDAVIAWENMLGSKSETTFKVCASLAWLLEPEDEERRRQLFAMADKIYGLRSRLVHGSEDAETDSAIELARDALSLAVRAFRRISSDSSLAQMRSSARSKMILLGAHSADG
ncbi:HEPN domain-containing protein [Brevibacterium luteolum]|nr:HEPN domain-containing protein [Brevibacterium luteolum]